jgi:hypothetical protein
MRFTELSFAVIENYLAMQRAVSGLDFQAAIAAGERGLAAREELTQMNPTFTTYKNIGEHGAAWWPGEVQQYRDLLALTDGRKGTLLLRDASGMGLPPRSARYRPAAWMGPQARLPRFLECDRPAAVGRAAQGLSGRVGEFAHRPLRAGTGRAPPGRAELHRSLLVSDGR